MALYVGHSDRDGLKLARYPREGLQVDAIRAVDLDGDGMRDIGLIDDLGATIVRQMP